MDSTYFKDKNVWITGAASGISQFGSIVGGIRCNCFFSLMFREEKLLEVVQKILKMCGIVN